MEEQDIYNYLISLNNKLIEPLSISEITNILRYNKNNFDLLEINPNKVLKYTNKSIVELLEIDSLEQEHMLQLIDEDTLLYRRKQSQLLQNQKRKSITKTNKDLFIKELFDLRMNYLMTNKEISLTKNVDIKTVNKHLNKDPKFVIIGRMDNKKLVDYYTKLGYSISQIAITLGVSKSLVKKYRNS